jgi:hypothetical protein
MNNLSYYEELTFNMYDNNEAIAFSYKIDCSPKNKKMEYKRKTEYEHDYISESIKEAIKHFKNTDLRRKDKTISPCTQSRYFYNMDIVKRVLEKLNNLNRVVTFRNIGDNQNPCYEMNFAEVLKNKKIEIF